jgi:transcriptional regulator with XRE-family HTH domain
MARDICISLGERIRKLRKQKGWRQIDLAQQSGIHEVHISDLERGAREAGLRTILAIAQALGVSLSDLFRGVDPGLWSALPDPTATIAHVASKSG